MLKKLKGLFVVEDGSSPKKVEEVKSKEPSIEEIEKSMNGEGPKKSNSAASTLSKTKEEKPRPKLSGKPEAKFVDVLLKSLEANNQEGFDYLEFKQSLQSLGNVEMDEKTRYQSALAMAKTMGASKSTLLQSAKAYTKVLDSEGAKFQQASRNQIQKQVVGKEDEIKSHQKAVADKEAMIKKLQKEIEQHRVKLEKTKTSLNNASAKVQLTSDKFMLAFDSVKGQILKDIENMNKLM